jgi:GNAT superfamily N-acetyltransferase
VTWSGPRGVLITGVFGSGKSAVAAEIGYLLERRGELYALLDLDYLGWVGDHDTGRAVMLRNLAAVAPNYRSTGVGTYVLAYFVRDAGTLEAIRDALAVPLRVVRLSVPIAEIERRLAADVTSGRRDDLRDAAESITASEGVGIEDLVIDNDRPVQVTAHSVMSWLGWLAPNHG